LKSAALALFAGLVLVSDNSIASSVRYCDAPVTLTVQQQDKLLRFSETIKNTLAQSNLPVALIARSGLDLSRFNTRYSHAGYSLKDSSNSPWSVRQLYYACDEAKPRIFDQGMAGFVLGTDSPDIRYISVVLLPAPIAQSVVTQVQDNARALALLNSNYSANAHAFSSKYQNCNQWIAEMLASALGALNGAAQNSPRDQAQAWLKQQGYAPSVMRVRNPLLMLAGAFMPMLNNDDHPPEDLQALQYQVSMPAAIEQFIRSQQPQAQRIEFCHNDHQIVIRQGWRPIDDGCLPDSDDVVIPF
jgi:hypothetical protein